MAFVFPGDLQVGGDLNLDPGSNINLPSGSDIVLGEGANIQGGGDLSGSFTGSFSGSIISPDAISTASIDAANVITFTKADETQFTIAISQTGSVANAISASHAITASFALMAQSVDFEYVDNLPANLVSSSQQIENFGFITSSVSGGVDFADVANKPSLISGSEQIEDLGFITASVSGGVDFTDITNAPSLVSGSSQIDLSQATGTAANATSASYALTASFALNAFDGISASFSQTASHALSVPFNVIQDLPENLVSGSQQIEDFGFITASVSGGVDFTDITNAPALISGSEQIEDLGFITASVSGGVDFADITNAPALVSSSQQIEDFGFITGSDTPGLVDSASVAVSSSYALTASFALNAFDGISASFSQTASHALSVPFNVIQNLPENLVSGSQQIEDFGFITASVSGGVDFADITNAPTLISGSEQIEDLGFITGSDTPGLVDSASLALRAEKLEKFENIRTINGQHALLMTEASESAGQTNGRAAIAGTNTSLGSLRFNPNRSGDGTSAELTIGASGVTGILDVDRIDMNANLIINDGVIDLLGVSNGGYIRFSNVTLPNAFSNQGTLARNNNNLQFSSGSSWYELFYKESQIDIGGTTGNISGSRVIGDIQASSVEYANVLNKPTLFSGSSQVNLANATGNANVANTASYIFYDGVDTINAGWVSSSAQIDVGNTTGNISGSRVIGDIQASSVEYANVLNKPALVSASAQVVSLIDGQDVSLGVVSAQEFNTSIVSSSILFTSGSNIFGDESSDTHEFTGSVSIKGGFTVEGKTFITSSGQIEDFGFITGSETFDASNIESSITALEQATSSYVINSQTSSMSVESSSFATTASHALDVPFEVISNLPDGLVSSSTQLSNVTASKINTSNSDTDDFFSIAFVNSSGSDTEIFTSDTLRYNPSLDILQVETFEGTAHTASFVTASNVHGAVATASLALAVDFDVITGLPDDLVSSSAQITLADTTGNISGSRVVGDIQASSVEYDNVLNKPTLVSSSAQVNLGSATGTAANATSASFATTASYANMAGAVDFNYVENLPDNLISSSQQVENTLLNNSVDFGTGTVTADEVHVSDRIRHEGDNDTSIVFQDNIVYINAGGRSNVGFKDTITVINEDGHDHDFRVESKDIAHMLYVDGGNNRVAIGKHNPIKELDVDGDVKADSYEGDGALLTNVTGSYVDMDDIDFSALTHYDDDTAAAAGGVPVGKLYRNGNFIQVRLS